MRNRIYAAVGLPVLAAGLTFGAGQMAAGQISSPGDAPDARRPTAAPANTDADLYGEALGAHQAAAGGAYVQAQLADFYAKLAAAEAEAAARAAASRGRSGGGGGACGGNHLDCIKQCESHGDYGAVSSNGTYRGAYQFDQGTWEAVGGSGDPAAAAPAEQDARAQELYNQRGSAPWGCA